MYLLELFLIILTFSIRGHIFFCGFCPCIISVLMKSIHILIFISHISYLTHLAFHFEWRKVNLNSDVRCGEWYFFLFLATQFFLIQVHSCVLLRCTYVVHQKLSVWSLLPVLYLPTYFLFILVRKNKRWCKEYVCMNCIYYIFGKKINIFTCIPSGH